MSDLNIVHIDMDAFFAAVEQHDNPELKGKPVVVGGTELDDRGVVATASYEARKYGIHSAMPIREAKSLCPQAVYLPGRHKRYAAVSEQIFSIFYKYTPLVEKVSIDEAFLDLKGCHRIFGNTETIAGKIKREIKNATGLTASVGIAPNKFLAKLSSDMDKPDGFVIIREEEVEEVLASLPVSKLWGVGEKTEQVLREKGIKTTGKLRELSLSTLENMLGKQGKKLYKLARGIDNRAVNPVSSVKSISHERTFASSLNERDRIYAVLLKLSQKVIRRLRRKKLAGSTVFLKIRYDSLRTVTRRITLSTPVNSIDGLYRAGRRLLEENNLLDKPVRLLGIGISNLIRNQKQLSLFSREKKQKLSGTIENIRDKFGEESIGRARNLYYRNDD